MIESLKARLGITLFIFLMALAWTMPNFVNLKDMWWPSQDKLAYGLDIKGGLHLVLGIDVDGAVETRINKMAYTMKEQLKKDKNITLGEVKVIDPKEGKLRVFFQAADRNAVQEYMEDTSYGQGRYFQTLDVTDQYIESRFTQAEMKVFKKGLVDRTIETIRNRTDEFGVKEPTIAAQSDNRILVQLPDVKDPAQAKD
ncbi:MAG: protein translocase subunit SecD, partial [Pseudomonadota bacterium]